MRKLVMAGLTVPTVLLAAVALCGPAMAAEEDGQGALNDRTLDARKVDTQRARAVDRDNLSDTTVVLAAQEGRMDTMGTRDGRTDAASAARADRRGRQAPRRTDAGALIDEEAWAWHHKNGNGCNGQGNCFGHDEDEDDDEDQSPPAP